jgi:hypothetical protein
MLSAYFKKKSLSDDVIADNLRSKLEKLLQAIATKDE